MKISVVGIGYVGLPTAVGFALTGNNVVAVTLTKSKEEMINNGRSPIYERGLEPALKKVLRKKTFRCTTNLEEAVLNSGVTFVSVGTPSEKDGSINLDQIKKCAEQIGEILKKKQSYHVIVVKSTVVPGTTAGVVLPAIEKFSGKKAGIDFGLAMNPEFLREGVALDDFMNSDRIVIGSIDKKSGDAVAKCYKNLKTPIIKTNVKTAELAKYAANSMFASLISFSNEIANIAEKTKGIDNSVLFESIHLDRRITSNRKKAGIAHYIKSGSGYGGSCFPKDVNAIVKFSESIGYKPSLLKEVKRINDERIDRIIKRAENFGKLKGKTISILGLAFKADTDDIRESQGVKLMNKLAEKGCKVNVYDPMALRNVIDAKNVTKHLSVSEAMKDSEMAFIMADWSEFKNLSAKDFTCMKSPVVFDSKGILNKNKIKGITYLTHGEKPE